MKTLLIEKTTIGSSDSEVIMIHDQKNKRSLYVYTNEVGYKDWVITQSNAFRNNGYRIFNTTNIDLKEPS